MFSQKQFPLANDVLVTYIQRHARWFNVETTSFASDASSEPTDHSHRITFECTARFAVTVGLFNESQ